MGAETLTNKITIEVNQQELERLRRLLENEIRCDAYRRTEITNYSFPLYDCIAKQVGWKRTSNDIYDGTRYIIYDEKYYHEKESDDVVEEE